MSPPVAVTASDIEGAQNSRHLKTLLLKKVIKGPPAPPAYFKAEPAGDHAFMLLHAWWLSLDDGLQPVPTTEEGLSRRSSSFEGHSSSLFHCIIQCQLALYNPVERSSRLERCPLKILVRYDNIPLPLWQHPSSVAVTTLSVVVTNLSSY